MNVKTGYSNWTLLRVAVWMGLAPGLAIAVHEGFFVAAIAISIAAPSYPVLSD